VADGPRELRLCVTAPDYDEALRFYRDVLGLAEQATYSSDDGGRVTILHAGRATLELADPAYAAYIDEVEVGRRVAGQVRVGFEVGDPRAVTARLAAAGASVVAEPVRTPWDSLNARLDGPAGLHLTVFSPEVYVSGQARLDGKVVLADPDPAWPGTAARLTDAIRTALGDRARLLTHVGSTSVPDLPAKPVIDLVLAVDDPADEASYVPPLEAIGYRLRVREPEWHEHRLLKLTDPEVNLHVFALGSEEVDRMIAFRDHLRRDPADRARYAATKRDLAARDWEFVQDYADAKSDAVADIMTRALARTASLAGVFVLVSGPPGSGKSTLARDLAPRIGLPLLAKDTLKQALMDALGVPDVEASRRIGRAAVDGLLALAADSGGAVLEGPWHRDRAPVLAALPGRVLEIFCRSDVVTEPVAGGWPVLEVDTSAPVDPGRLSRRVRQLAARD
jgi:GrpB-like predicted nucleotidyltransferase (UPF0157 family)/predicted enzyme related to lactoylglutathione lyase